MRCLERNKVPFWYSLFSSKTPVTDSNNRYTGEYTLTYSTPVKTEGNISPARGDVQREWFSDLESYDRVIVLDLKHKYINENTRLWIDTNPEQNQPHDYVVTRVAVSLNNVALAIRKVTVK